MGNDSRTLPGNAGMEGKETGNSQTSSVIKIPELYTKSTTKTLTGLDAWKQIGSTTVEMVGNTAQVGFYVAVSSGATAMTGPGGALVTAAIAEEVARNTAQAGYGFALVVSSIIYTINDGGFGYTEITLTDPNGNSNELLDKVINLPSVSPIKK